jgi:hypothetical protein
MLRFLFMFAAEAGGDMLNKMIIYFVYRINAASTVRQTQWSPLRWLPLLTSRGVSSSPGTQPHDPELSHAVPVWHLHRVAGGLHLLLHGAPGQDHQLVDTDDDIGLFCTAHHEDHPAVLYV